MSSNTIHETVVIKFDNAKLTPHLPPRAFFFEETSYLYFEKHSCSNAEGKHWHLTALGSHAKVMTRIIHLSADTEEGMLRLAEFNRTTPEKYIARARQHLAAAIPVQKSSTSEEDLLIPLDFDRMTRASALQKPQARAMYEEQVYLLKKILGDQPTTSLRPIDRPEHAAALFYWLNILSDTALANAKTSPFWLNMNLR